MHVSIIRFLSTDEAAARVFYACVVTNKKSAPSVIDVLKRKEH
jgi:hypothetical protein